MLHYITHAGSVPWQEQLRWMLGILLCIAALFLFFWWRRRSSRPARGDFAALAQAPQVQAALIAQQTSAGEDAAAAWQQTQTTLHSAQRAAERGPAIVFCLLSGMACFFTGLMALTSLAGGWAGVSWGTLLVWVLFPLTGWFARVQWREFRGRA